MNSPRGFFGIGIENGKTGMNLGTLWRSANLFGADFIFTIGKRYGAQSSDTYKTPQCVPLYHYENFDDMYSHMPHDCRLIGIELATTAVPIKTFNHPERCIYLLGAEDNGLTSRAIEKCHKLIVLPGESSMNVAVAGSIVMFDRINKQ